MEEIIIGGDALAKGTPIKGLLLHEVEWLKRRSKTVKDLYKNTINLWLWKSEDHVVEMLEVLKDNKERAALANPTGASTTKTMGAGVSMPAGLYQFLNKVNPELFNNKRQLAYFRKEFPQFKVYRGF